MCLLTLAACSSKGSAGSTTTQASTPTGGTGGGSSGSGGSGSSPGVTSTSVTVGQVDDLSSPIPGLFKGAEDGTKAYFAYVNSMGGVNGRKLILDAEDSAFQGGQVATETGTQIRTEFGLVGGFSLLDSAEKPLIDIAHVPDVGFSLSPGLSSDPYLYSPLPNPENYYPLNLFKYLQKKYPQQVKKVGIIWENATASTTSAENAVEAAMKASGFDIVYDHGVGPFDTNFLPDIISMQGKGVKMFFSTELPDNYASTLAKQMQQQGFKPINIEGAAYSNQLLSLAGSAANNMYIEQGYALYLGQDAQTVPAVGLFDKWMKKVDPKANFEIESVYGWASAELFAQALKSAGNPPTRAGLIQALNNVTFFDAGGLVPPSNPAQAVPSGCFLLAQVQNGRIKRVPPTPNAGFYCGSNSFLKESGYTKMVRPTS
ncbi:MAG TPA: ABC transporter substrate-binding protein [Acidimicrobiales bacterium]|nr:ABC transporter substrate-binding protein [Acidimicrobiales bacterium]